MNLYGNPLRSKMKPLTIKSTIVLDGKEIGTWEVPAGEYLKGVDSDKRLEEAQSLSLRTLASFGPYDVAKKPWWKFWQR